MRSVVDRNVVMRRIPMHNPVSLSPPEIPNEVPRFRNRARKMKYVTIRQVLFFVIFSGKRLAEFVWNISGSAMATGDFHYVSMFPLTSIFTRSLCSSISVHAGP